MKGSVSGSVQIISDPSLGGPFSVLIFRYISRGTNLYEFLYLLGSHKRLVGRPETRGEQISQSCRVPNITTLYPWHISCNKTPKQYGPSCRIHIGGPAQSTARALSAQSTPSALQKPHPGPYNIPQRGPWRFQHGWNVFVYVSVYSVCFYKDFVACSLRSLNQKNLLGLLYVKIFSYSFLCLLFIGFFTQYGMWCVRVC